MTTSPALTDSPIRIAVCRVAIAALLLAGCALALSARAASPIKSAAADALTKPPVMVEMPSALPDKTRLRGAWLSATTGTASALAKRRPAVVLLHGCGGAFDSQGKIFTRTLRYAGLLNNEGWHVLVLDSYGPRGERSVCKLRPGHRRITQLQRRRDVFGALVWLSGRADVDPERLALLGWSNGGSTVLASTNGQHAEVTESARKPRAAVAFYPGCEAELRRGYAANTSLLLMLGEDDDWTPSQACVELAQSDTSHISYKLYPGAHHGFDSRAPLRLRRDVPNRLRPGEGVHVGGQPDARRDSVKTVISFLRERLAS
ncbi:MAG: dienelactone hydrolase family protein [Burkholderiales bacterium]|nr:dienelactone hydrolase family protein [Burkholderiales bacterium]